jgi:hypothetical protein
MVVSVAVLNSLKKSCPFWSTHLKKWSTSLKDVGCVEDADLREGGRHRRAALQIDVDVAGLHAGEPFGVGAELAVREQVQGEVEVLPLDPLLEQLHSTVEVGLGFGLRAADLQGQARVLALRGGRVVLSGAAGREDERHGNGDCGGEPAPAGGG